MVSVSRLAAPPHFGQVQLTKDSILASGDSPPCPGANSVIGGSLRGLYAGFVILILTAPIRTGLIFNGLTVLIMFLNGTVFATIALVLSFLAKSYTDAPRFTSYIIMPMSFLCNPFVSTDQMPGAFRYIVGALPLSQASRMIRSISHGENPGRTGYGILLIYLAVFSLISIVYIYRKKTL